MLSSVSSEVDSDVNPISGMVSMLQDRMTMYTEAKECARAKGDSSKARRMDRGVKVWALNPIVTPISVLVG